ncbi:hypothetical protein DQ04_11191000 [Trypanosoma grayi]|uniref:hypothetical protein n=1 Tax=Trypanosoma grayi TaxID=71804 RepID=UPI0004F4B271|nr:hypothetical protein DQ04_11191000 [Trypanosoma grayi]KEG07027.1 hypothetical protein DQ04_11191000 [Trypanosoma grayi]
MGTRLYEATAPRGSLSSLPQQRDISDMRQSIERIEELLHRGEELLYGEDNAEADSSVALPSPAALAPFPAAAAGGAGADTSTPKDVANGDVVLKRPKGQKATPRQNAKMPEPLPPAAGAGGRPYGDHRRRAETHATQRRQMPDGTPKAGAGAAPHHHSSVTTLRHSHSGAPRKLKKGVTSNEDSDEMEDVSIAELRLRIQHELEEYRRNGSAMQLKPRQSHGTTQGLGRAPSHELGGTTTIAAVSVKKAARVLPQRDTRTHTASRVAHPLRENRNKNINKNVENRRNNNKSNTKKKPTPVPAPVARSTAVAFVPFRSKDKTIHGEGQHVPAWMRLYGDAIRLREKRRQQQEAEEQRQHEEMLSAFKATPYKSDTLMKRFSLKSTSVKTPIRGAAKTRGAPARKKEVPRAAPAPALAIVQQQESKRNGVGQWHAPGCVFPRRQIKPRDVLSTKLGIAEKRQEEEEAHKLHQFPPEELHEGGVAIARSTAPLPVANETPKETGQPLHVAVPKSESFATPERNGTPEARLHSESHQKTLESTGSSASSSMRWVADSLASSGATPSMPLRQSGSAVKAPIPSFVKPLNFRALRK